MPARWGKEAWTCLFVCFVSKKHGATKRVPGLCAVVSKPAGRACVRACVFRLGATTGARDNEYLSPPLSLSRRARDGAPFSIETRGANPSHPPPPLPPPKGARDGAPFSINQSIKGDWGAGKRLSNNNHKGTTNIQYETRLVKSRQTQSVHPSARAPRPAAAKIKGNVSPFEKQRRTYVGLRELVRDDVESCPFEIPHAGEPPEPAAEVERLAHPRGRHADASVVPC